MSEGEEFNKVDGRTRQRIIVAMRILDMDSSIEDIEFIASSKHRVGVLDALAEGRCDRDDLRSATRASSPTMGRVLGDFGDRRWIERIGATYELTPLVDSSLNGSQTCAMR